MNNSFMSNLKQAANYTYTENLALAHKSTMNAVYDLFATGAAYRKRSDEDCILLFKNAFDEDRTLAMKCLFYLRDCRGGQGERRFFRVCFRWLADNFPETASRNLEQLSEYGRWDDLIYCTLGTRLQNQALRILKVQLALDIECKTPSLLAKWLPSENASAFQTKRYANVIRNYLGMTHRQYRKTLSVLRERINIVERLMSANRWDEIEFDKIPSRAGLIYKNAFARRDIIAKKYEKFAKSEDTTVNASVLYPYEVVQKAVATTKRWGYNFKELSATDRAMIEKYWNNLPDYLNGADMSMLCVIDTSGSMTGSEASAPLNVAIGLGMYCAERMGGAFKDHYISFSRNPQLIKIEGVDFVDKVRRIYETNLCENTDLVKVFRMLKRIAVTSREKDIPKNIVIISDMQIDSGIGYYNRAKERVLTEMEMMRREWEDVGLEMPHLIYWNVAARTNANFLEDAGENVTYVSGMSPTIFKAVLTGKTEWDLCLEAITAKRYDAIKG